MMMLDPTDPLAKLLRDDKRYRLEAYAFVWEALKFAQNEIHGGPQPAGEGAQEAGEDSDDDSDEEAEAGEPHEEQHLTGQQLCAAIRRYALEQYGFMAKTVFNSWGVNTTGDFGEIVFNFIAIGRMRKTPEDRREDFDDVFDFETGLVQDFKITLPK